MAIAQLIIAVAACIAAAVIVYQIEKKTAFFTMKYWKRQVIIGIVFGFLSILGTELGSDINGAVINVRDAAPVTAGLMFGGPAGIIAGLIGGIERYFAVYWWDGSGAYTQIACTVATIFAGFFSAFMRKFIFENKRPPWFFGVMVAVVIEVFHMILVFATHTYDPHGAYSVVNACTVPMVVLNSVAVLFSIMLARISGRKPLIKPRHLTRISQSIQKWLLVIVLLTFVLTTLFVFSFQTNSAYLETSSLLEQALEDTEKSINEASDENILRVTRKIAEVVDESLLGLTENLNTMAELYGVREINIVSDKGRIIRSTDTANVGFSMSSGEQSSYFMQLLDNDEMTEIAQPYMPMTRDNTIYRKYAAVKLSTGGFVQVGYDSDQFQDTISGIIKESCRNRHVGQTGSILILNSDMEYIGEENINQDVGSNLESIIQGDFKNDDEVKYISELDLTHVSFGGNGYFIMSSDVEGYYILAVRPAEEALFTRNMSVYLTLFMEMLTFTLLFIVIYILVKRLVVNKFNLVNDDLGKITDGDLNVVVDVRSNSEFVTLSDGINSTVDTLKRYIAEATERFRKELEYAKEIQYSSLPHVFPPFPDRNEIDIWANMLTAKEVGGDFYDFYFVSQNKVAFLVADVSGKGIPAALFMMRSKTMIKNLAATGMGVTDVFSLANDNLCENNEAEMFVTCWMGILDIETGVLKYASAGHNPPLLWRESDGDTFDYMRAKNGLVLAGMEGVRYRENEITLVPGDVLFLYTDGVTEATDLNNELYGDDRLKNFMSSITDKADRHPEDICMEVKADVDRFVGEADQFDDITVLCVKYNGPSGA